MSGASHRLHAMVEDQYSNWHTNHIHIHLVFRFNYDFSYQILKCYFKVFEIKAQYSTQG